MLAAGGADAEAAWAKVPPGLRADPGLLYAEARWRRKKDMTDAAVQILLAHPGDPVRPELWAAERQVIARRVLAAGNAELAYRIAEQHGAIDGNAFADAEFLLGYIALRYMKDPARAFDDFSRILTRADSPYAKARAGYWGGRAAEAQAKPALAQKWYAAGAEHMATFYGQLAAHQLGDDAPPHPVPEPRPDAAEQARFDGDELVRADRAFFALADRADSKIFLLDLAGHAKTPTEFAMLADLAEKNGRIDLAIAVAKRAIDAGTPLMIHGYPVTALPAGGTAEHALLYAIVRQESAFEVDAVSRSGARGLMQLMPATAAFIAAKIAAALLGRAADRGRHLQCHARPRLSRTAARRFRRLLCAGDRRLQRRARAGCANGSPITATRAAARSTWSIGSRSIPVAETRNYVQRVLENLQVYRGQDGRSSAFSLVSDLAR